MKLETYKQELEKLDVNKLLLDDLHTLKIREEEFKNFYASNLIKEEERIFLNETGGAISTYSIRTQFRKYRKKAKLNEKFVVHSLRHSFATDLIERGANIIQVKELMGHSNIRSTMEYIHIAKMEIGIKSPIDKLIEGEI